MVVYPPNGYDVAAFLGQPDNAGTVALAQEQLPIVTAMARSYTRGNGFDAAGEPADDLAAVITTATARLLGNPTQDRAETVGPYAVTHTPFVAWTLVESCVLNRYRRRTA